MTVLCILWFVTIDLLADSGVIIEPSHAHGWWGYAALVLAILHDVYGYYVRSK